MTDAPKAHAVSERDAMLTFRIPRTAVFASVGLFAGFLLGLGTAYVVIPAGQVDAVVTENKPPAVRGVNTDGRPARGADSARVTVVEFTDYECPFCRQHARQTLPVLLDRYGDRVRYVVMNYPIPMLHENAVAAAEAAECAGDQGRVWEYHDQLFGVDTLTLGRIRQIATRLRLDPRAFATCVDTHARAALVQRHIALAESLGVTGTPSFFVNGRLIDGAVPFAVFQTVIDSALAAAR